MKTLLRRLCMFGAALALAVLLNAAARQPGCVYAGCEAGVTWQIDSETTSRETSDTVNGKTTHTEDITITSHQQSDDGREFTDNQTFHRNADGSSHGTEDITITDTTGEACDSDGVPFTARLTGEEDTDAEGNRKFHREQLIKKNGKCIKNTRDWEVDKKGRIKNDTGWVETEVPCNEWNLQIHLEYVWSGSGDTRKEGPNTYLIPLTANGTTLTGKYAGVFNSMGSGICNWVGESPITFDITATQEKFGDQDEMAFSVTEGVSFAGLVAKCTNGNEALDATSYPIKITFTLPAEDGASWKDSSGGLTFTLIKQ